MTDRRLPWAVRLRLFSAVFCLPLFVTVAALAQQDYAKLEGSVRGKTGALIPNAPVKISAAALSVERVASSAASGFYIFPQLRPGVYKITVAAHGFKSAAVSELRLGVGQNRALDFELDTGQVTEIIQFTANDAATTVDTASARLGANVTVREVAELPVNGRNVAQLYALSPGAVLAPFGEIDYKTSGGRDSFNALQVTVNRRFTAGLTLGGHYQWVHSIGTTQGSNEAQTTQDPFNFNGERGNNTFDIRQTANLTALYELPFGKGRWWDLDGAANVIAGGWQMGGILNTRSGTPLDVRLTRPDVVIQCTNAAAGCTAGEVRGLPGAIAVTTPLPAGFLAVINTPGGNSTRNTRRPDRLPGVDPYQRVGSLRWLNPAAFTIPRPGAYGNLARGALYGPSFAQFDLTLQKRFELTEKLRFEFRAELYNLFNRTNFANPPVTLPNNLGAQQPGQPFRYTSETDNNVGNFGLFSSTVSRTVGLGTNRQVQFSGRISF